MAAKRREGIEVRPDGVVWYTDEDLDRWVWLRVRPAGDQRWVIRELYLPKDDRPLTTDDLRRIPLGRIEAHCNTPAVRAQLGDALLADPLVSLSLEEAHRQALDAADHELRGVRKQSRTQLRVHVPEAREYGDAFYRRVADLYLRLASEGRAPAPAIADANDVPVTTARRWAKEARRRGFLPPGRSGKVG